MFNSVFFEGCKSALCKKSTKAVITTMLILVSLVVSSFPAHGYFVADLTRAETDVFVAVSHDENVVTKPLSAENNIIPVYRIADMAKMPEGDAICIPGTGINHTVNVGNYTQYDVDRYNIVYTEGAYGASRADTVGATNPFVLGHYYGSLGALYKTNIGQHIYLTVGDKTEVYQVFVSEAGNTSGPRDILGQDTGTNVVDAFETKTLHLYTCYHAAGSNGRWIVLAELVDVIYEGEDLMLIK